MVNNEIARTANSTCTKGVGLYSKDIFWVNQILIFKIKFCGRVTALRVAAKRYE